METLVEFETETFLEEDDVWDALFVRVNSGKWMMAMPNFKTEDRQEIINIISNDPRNW